MISTRRHFLPPPTLTHIPPAFSVLHQPALPQTDTAFICLQSRFLFHSPRFVSVQINLPLCIGEWTARDQRQVVLQRARCCAAVRRDRPRMREACENADGTRAQHRSRLTRSSRCIHAVQEMPTLDIVVLISLFHIRYCFLPVPSADDSARPLSLLAVDGEELDLEDEGGVGRDDRGEATSTVGVVGGAGELGLLAEGELRNTLVPALDDLAYRIETRRRGPQGVRQDAGRRKRQGTLTGQLWVTRMDTHQHRCWSRRVRRGRGKSRTCFR